MPKTSGRGYRSEAPPSPQSIAKWTLKLENVLTTTDARHRFKRFLIEQENTNALDTLYFWKECTRLQSSSQTEQSIGRVKELAERVQFEDLSVNLDGSLLERLFDINDATSLQEILGDVLKVIINEDIYLKDAYMGFCAMLNKPH